jgi:hypothetical protein
MELKVPQETGSEVSVAEKFSPVFKTVIKGVVFVLLVAPCAGAVVGGLVAGVAFEVSGEHFSFGASFGMVFGASTGFACSLYFVWFLHNRSLVRLTVYMGLGTLCGAIPIALIPGCALFAYPGGIIGCYVGFDLFRSGHRIERYIGWGDRECE